VILLRPLLLNRSDWDGGRGGIVNSDDVRGTSIGLGGRCQREGGSSTTATMVVAGYKALCGGHIT